MREDLYGSDLLDTVNHLLFLAGRVSQETVILEKCDNEAVGGRKHITFPGYSHQVKKWLVFQVTALRGQIFVLLFWKSGRPFKGHWSVTDSSHDSRIFLHRWMNMFSDFVRSQPGFNVHSDVEFFKCFARARFLDFTGEKRVNCDIFGKPLRPFKGHWSNCRRFLSYHDRQLIHVSTVKAFFPLTMLGYLCVVGWMFKFDGISSQRWSSVDGRLPGDSHIYWEILDEKGGGQKDPSL